MSTNQDSDINLTEKDLKVFEAKKSSYFKGSIAVAVVYGVVALVLVLFASFSDTGRQVLATDLKPFVITLVVGILLVIATIAIQLYTLKPIRIKSTSYSGDMCPDFWHLEQTPEEVLDQMDEEKRFLGAQRCVRTTNANAQAGKYVSDSPTPIRDTVNYTTEENKKVRNAMRQYMDEMDISDAEVMSCNMLYPMSLDSLDNEAFPDKKNTLRCDLAQKCGFSWSSVC